MSKHEQQSLRIKCVFGGDEIPNVSSETLKIYCEYLSNNITLPCLLIGRESMGFFSWEGRFQFGSGTDEEYRLKRKEEGSCKDKYELKIFDAFVEEDWNILVNVKRIPHYKKFTIPLSDLEVIDKNAPNFQLLDDYSVWCVNWH